MVGGPVSTSMLRGKGMKVGHVHPVHLSPFCLLEDSVLPLVHEAKTLLANENVVPAQVNMPQTLLPWLLETGVPPS